MRRFQDRQRPVANWLVCAPFLLGTAWAAGPRVADAPTVAPETDPPIWTLQDAAGQPIGRRLTLQQALDRAAADPQDNSIRLDAAAFRREPRTVRPAAPWTYAPTGPAGRDVLDGTGGRLVLQAADNASAALSLHRGTLEMRSLAWAGGSRGVMVTDEAEAVLDECMISASAGSGLAVFGRGRATVRNGRIDDNASHGVEVHGAGVVALQQTSLARNGQSGLALFDDAHLDAQTCLLEANGQWGAVVDGRSRLALHRTEIRESAFAGLDASGRATVVLDACRLLHGRRFGLVASGNAQLDLCNTDIAHHASRGLELQNDARVAADRCRIEDSGNFGVVLFGQSALRFDKGVIRGNRGHGLALRDRATAEIRDSLFEHNEFSGAGAPDASVGGRLTVRRCLFRGNGMRPIFRGPTHLDPLVPTTSEIRGDAVLATASPFAEVDLYADRAGEASRFLETVTADARGQFRVSPAAARWPDVVTAAATTPDGHTSEFNVIAGPPSRAILAALLARAGPLSDAETARIDMRSAVHRWPTGTRVSFRFETPAPPHVRRGVEWFAERIPVWTAGNVRVDLRQGPAGPDDEPTLVPIRYAPARDERLNGTGGTTYTRWDATGFFSAPIRIFLAEPEPGRPACPRVAIHEMCHALGLYHARVGLLSRMQGIPAPPPGYLNDFSPAPTFYDVTALQILYDNRLEGRVTLARLAAAGLMPAALPEESGDVAARPIDADASSNREASSVGPPPVFSPPATSR